MLPSDTTSEDAQVSDVSLSEESMPSGCTTECTDVPESESTEFTLDALLSDQSEELPSPRSTPEDARRPT